MRKKILIFSSVSLIAASIYSFFVLKAPVPGEEWSDITQKFQANGVLYEGTSSMKYNGPAPTEEEYLGYLVFTDLEYPTKDGETDSEFFAGQPYAVRNGVLLVKHPGIVSPFGKIYEVWHYYEEAAESSKATQRKFLSKQPQN